MAKKKTYSKDFLLDLYRTMYKIRVFEETGVKLYRQGLIRGYFHPYWGEEAIAVGACAALTENDYIASTHRGHGHCIAWGADINRMVAELLGKKTGYCQGLGGSMHIADYTKGNLGANGIVASGVPIGVGAALGAKIRGESRIACVFSSDGASNSGPFAEGLNLAGAWNLPVIIFVENNQYAVSTPIEESTRETNIHKRADGYGVKNFRVNGNDVLEVYEKMVECVEECHKGNGPFLIEGLTFRKSGHHVNDPGTYLPADKVDFYAKNDPLIIGQKHLKDNGITDAEIDTIHKEVQDMLDKAIEFSNQSEEMTKEEFLTFIEEF